MGYFDGLGDTASQAGGAVGGFLGGEGVFGRNLITDPFGDVEAAKAQAKAQKEAMAQQERLAAEAQRMFQQQSELGIGYIQQGAGQGASALQQYGQQAQGLLGRTQAQGLAALSQSNQNALGSLAGGYNQARGDLGVLTGLQGYRQGATRGISSYDVTGRRGYAEGMMGGQLGANPYDVTGQRSRLEGLMDRGDALSQRLDRGVDLEGDRGYQFRLKQGEDAIMRSAAARGGRLGGATLKALQEHGQEMASQEYDKAAARQMATNQQQLGLLGQQYGAAGSVDQFGQAAQFNQAGRTDASAQQAIQNRLGLAQFADQQSQAALMNQAGRSDAAALAAQQNQMALAQMGYGAQGQLAQYSQQLGQQRAGMQSSYGSQAADLLGQYAGQQAGIYGNLGSQLGSLYANAGANMGNVAIGVGGNNQQNANSLMGAYQNYAQYGGMTQQAQANSNREAAGMVASFFSDERLKTEIETIPSKYERIGLRGAQWRWNQQGERLGLHGVASGVIAQEVAQTHPQAVVEGPGGWLLVNYAELDRLVARAA